MNYERKPEPFPVMNELLAWLSERGIQVVSGPIYTEQHFQPSVVSGVVVGPEKPPIRVDLSFILNPR